MQLKHIGLTGNIGSGKSTVAKLLVAKGAALIDSDQLAKAASQDTAILQEIASKLGSDLVENGQLRRDKTAALVFSNAKALEVLNGIIHPWVRQESQNQAKRLAEQACPPELIVFDIPLLYENGLEHSVDKVIVVDAPLALRIARVKERSQLSEAEIKARDSAQISLAEKVKRADFVINNEGKPEELKAQVDALWEKLTLGTKEH